MSVFSRIKNLIAPRQQAGTNDDILLKWLGVDDGNPKAISEVTYYTCLKILSEAMGKMPLKLYQAGENGGRTVYREPSVGQDMLLNRPNFAMTPATFWSLIELNCEHFGNAYVYIDRGFMPQKFGGEVGIKGFWPMQSDCVTIYYDNVGIFGDAGGIYYQYADPSTGKQYMFKSSDVLHFKTWMTWDGVVGKSVQEILKTTVGAAAESQGYLNKLYTSGLTASSVLQYTGDLDDKLRKKLQDKYTDVLTGTKNIGKVVPLPVGMKLEPINYKLTDAQFYELKKYSALQIAGAFGIKPDQINNYEKSSYSSSEAQQLAFLVDTMLYRINAYEQEINYKVLTKEERDNGLFFKFNEKVMLRMSSEAQMNMLTSAVQNGIYTDNECRALLDKPPMDGGDQLIVNGNYIPLTQVGAAYGIQQEGGKDE